MGIHFACHSCGKRLNIKRDLAGKRGVCPQCDTRFRIPLQDSETSIPVEGSSDDVASKSDGRPNSSAPQTPITASTTAQAKTSFAILDVDDDATWYVRPPTGGQYGPASTVMLRQWIDEGRVTASSLLWRDGWPQWRTASESLPEFAETLRNSEAPPSTPVQTPSKTASMDATPTSFSGDATLGTERRQTQLRRTMMIASLVGLIVGLVAILFYLVLR
jgi:GYF domain 2